MNKADIGLIGLAVMGQNLVLNMNDHGFTVAVFNRTVSKVDGRYWCKLGGEAGKTTQATQACNVNGPGGETGG